MVIFLPVDTLDETTQTDCRKARGKSMKNEGFEWIDMSSGACVRESEPEAPLKAPAREVRGAMAEVKPSGHGSVELYLTQDGRLIRLENAEQCSPLDHACLLE
jgi:hypothetical protein